MANVKKDDVDVKALYGNDCVSSSEDFKKAHGVSDKGLSSKTAMERLKNLGSNQIKQAKQKNGTIIFLQVYLVLLIVSYLGLLLSLFIQILFFQKILVLQIL